MDFGWPKERQLVFGTGIRRFESCRPSQPSLAAQATAGQASIDVWVQHAKAVPPEPRRRWTTVKMQNVYILQSLARPERYYIGCTDDVLDRVRRHNAGQSESGSRHTSIHGPWQVVVQIGFEDRAKAFAFEKYLKSGSGRAFAKRHF
ncbi:GIY-YIG nuclease family protein [Sphingosinicella sp.]|uniref:GIY-YIG nuclease family protein n=1 Tax=Sphingosinicella sp. TaxID=1917971 RepID=UPI004037EC23